MSGEPILSCMAIEVRTGVTDDVVRQVNECYETYPSWADRDLSDVREALENSDEHVFVVETESDNVVASARVLTDYVYYGVIYDVIVQEEYRRDGFGERLMESVVHLPPLANVSQITLVARDGLVPFYEECGFTVHPMEIEIDGEAEDFNRMVLHD